MILNEFISRFLVLAVDLSESISPFLSGVPGRGVAGVAIGAGFGFLVLIFLVFVFFITGMALGKTRLVSSLISVYTASFIERVFPFQEELFSFFKDYEKFWVRIGVFVFFYAVSIFFLGKVIKHSRFSLSEIPFFTVLILSIIKAGFILSILTTYIPKETFNLFSSEFYLSYFGNPKASFLWALFPVLSFALAGRKKKVDDK